MYFIKERETAEKRLAKQNLDYWRQHPAKYALWYFNPYAPALQHGTINLLLVNIKIIVIMNQNLEHVQVFIEDDKFAL